MTGTGTISILASGTAEISFTGSGEGSGGVLTRELTTGEIEGLGIFSGIFSGLE